MFHLLVSEPISLYTIGDATSGSRDQEIETLFTVRLTMVSVISFHWTVRSPTILPEPLTSSLKEGVAVPIPIFDPLLYIFVLATQLVPL